MHKGAKAWLIIEQEATGDNEPDGKGGWHPKVITRVIAGTEDANCLNLALAAMQEYVSKVSEEKEALTIIRSNVVGEIIPKAVAEMLQESGEKSLLDEILDQS